MKTITSALAVTAFSTLTFVSGNVVAADFVIESNHTYPSFQVPHLGISWWHGKFNKTSGTLTYDAVGKSGTVDIIIDASSIDFGNNKMNDHAKTADFFNVAEYPNATYKGKMVFEGDTLTAVDGELTLLGNTKPVKLTVESFKCIMHPMLKKQACGAQVVGSFDRNDFGMSKYAKGDAGMVKLSIQVEAIKAN
ncbi:MAG: YceI family protein [Burkholderiaceae bacterium]